MSIAERTKNMSNRFLVPILGVLVAIAITATLDANGLTVFSALPLIPLLAIFWSLERLPRRDVGLVWGRARDYGLALVYPTVVIAVVTLIAIGAGGAYIDGTHWNKAVLNFVVIALATVIGALLTEEGFFRGWLWASFRKRGMSTGMVLICTSVAFALWHLSYATLAKGYTLPPLQVALFILNAAVIGAIWGMMRSISGSIVVSSVSHGLWNGAAYAFFGEGPKSGPLGLPNTIVFGPEIGVIGLAANVLFFFALYFWYFRQRKGVVFNNTQ
jgi:membrane protease YdiL (CAAX protease family)